MTRGWVVAVTVAGLLVTLVPEVEGQRFRRHDRGPKAHFGIALLAAEPVGELGA